MFKTSVIETSRAAAKAAHKKLLNTAYQLAMMPTRLLQHFEILIKVQKSNGVKLIQGKQDGRAAKEYVFALRDAGEEKCVIILGSKHFMSVLSDGSQVGKMKNDKKMVMVRVERNGLR